MAKISTDKTDYAPGETATITLTDFDPGLVFNFTIQEWASDPGDDGFVNTYYLDPVIDGGTGDLDGVVNGQIVTDWLVPADPDGDGPLVASALNATLDLTATNAGADGELGTDDDITAMTTFTDAGTNYTDLDGRITNNYQAWDPNPAVDNWVTGNYSHVAEGDIVAFSVEVTFTEADVNQNFEFTVSFDYDQSSTFPPDTGIGPYAYIDLEQYNTTYVPVLRGSAINSTVDGASIDGDGTILNVYSLPQGVGADPGAAVTEDDQLAYEIELMAPSTAGTYYIYFGAELAKAGAMTEYGDIVGTGEGLSAWPVGTFQTNLEQTTGAKTVNAKPGDIETEILITKLVDTDGDGDVDLTGRN